MRDKSKPLASKPGYCEEGWILHWNPGMICVPRSEEARAYHRQWNERRNRRLRLRKNVGVALALLLVVVIGLTLWLVPDTRPVILGAGFVLLMAVWIAKSPGPSSGPSVSRGTREEQQRRWFFAQKFLGAPGPYRDYLDHQNRRK